MKRTICLLVSVLFCIAPAMADGLGLTTVVIDPGHGGKDPGCVSSDGRTLEKHVTLDISRTLAKRIREEYPDVKVVLTRDKDVFVPLNERAAIANKHHADLFISVHINAATSKSPNGYSLHILGERSASNRDLYAYNTDVCKRENAVIMLEEDYTTKYQGFDPNDPTSYIFMQLMQNSHREQSLRFAECARESLGSGPIKADRGIWQNAFVVLINTSMPSVLVELGFMSNANDLASLRQQSKRDELAECLLEAFGEYKKVYDDSISAPDGPEKPEQPTQPGKVSTEQQARPVDRNLFPGGAKGEQADSAAVSGKELTEETALDSIPAADIYAVQVLATGKKRSLTDSELFVGYVPMEIYDGRLYRYFIAVGADPSVPQSALVKIREKYPDAFVVRIAGGVVQKY